MLLKGDTFQRVEADSHLVDSILEYKWLWPLAYFDVTIFLVYKFRIQNCVCIFGGMLFASRVQSVSREWGVTYAQNN